MLRKSWLPHSALMVAFALTATAATTSSIAYAQEADPLYRPEISADDIKSSLGTEWYGLYLKGKKIGYFRTTRSSAEDRVTESFLLHMKLVSFGKKAEMTITQTLDFAPKAPYKMQSGAFEVFDGTNRQKFTAQRAGKGFQVQAEISGQKSTKQLPDVDYSLFDTMATEMWVKSGPKVDAVIRYQDFDFQEWKLDRSTAKVLGEKSSLVGGVPVKFYEVETRSDSKNLAFVSRYGANGTVLSGNFAIFEIRNEPEKLAKNIEYSQDLFVLGMAKVNRPLGHTTRLTELVLQVPEKEGKVFESAAMQSVVPGPEGSLLIKIGKEHGLEMKASKKDIEEALAETNTLPITHPDIQELAKKAVGDAKTPEEKLKRIVTFVHRYISPRLSASLPNIHDLLKHKSGDCKSYALLTTNLCRAAGIPAREVSGLLYMGDDTKAFGGHAWNEVVMDGKWQPVDSSLGQTEVDAGHIYFGPEDRALSNMLQSLGKLSFRVVQFSRK